jgi:hypothetical protein
VILIIDSSYVIVSLFAQTSHLIFPHPISPSSSRLPSYFAHPLFSLPRTSSSLFLPPKINRPQLAPLARPDAQAGHKRGAGGLQSPPEEVARDGVRVQRGDEEVDGVEGEGEVEDEFAARNEDEDEYRTATN